MKKHEIVITVRGGLIQEIDGIPRNIRIIVRDFDVDNDPLHPCVEEINGELAFVGIWESYCPNCL